MAELLFDFDNPAGAKRSLKRVAQAMLRAGQPVVSSDFDPKVRRTAGVSYRQAMLTLASGQTVGLMIKLTGDVFRVLLNGAVLPIKNQDGLKAIAEIAAAAERNQAKFQKAQARKLVELPKSIRTAAPRMEQVLQQRNTELDAQIAERTAERDALKAELGDQALDSVDEAVALAARVIGGEALDSADLSDALATLRIALDAVETNAPINEAAGNVEQAALERANAESFRQAIELLDSASEDDEDSATPPSDDQASLFDEVDDEAEAGAHEGQESLFDE